MHKGEQGFTVVEVMIGMVLSMMASASIMGILVSQNNAEKRATDFTVNQEEARQALVYLQRDLRSAEPIVGVTQVADYAYQVDLDVYDSIDAETPDKVSWKLETATNTLHRYLINADGSRTSTYSIRGVANDDISQPLFQYFNDKNIGYDILSQVAAPEVGTVAYCTVRVRIDLRAAPNGSPAPVRLESDVMLRNKLPGAYEC